MFVNSKIRAMIVAAAIAALGVTPAIAQTSRPPIVNAMPGPAQQTLELGSSVVYSAFNPHAAVAYLLSTGQPANITLGVSIYDGMGQVLELVQSDTLVIHTINLAGVPATDIQVQSGTSKVFNIHLVEGQTIVLHALNGTHFGGPGSQTHVLWPFGTNASDLDVTFMAANSFAQL